MVKCQHNLVRLRKQTSIPVATPADGFRLFTCKEQATKPGSKDPGFFAPMLIELLRSRNKEPHRACRARK